MTSALEGTGASFLVERFAGARFLDASLASGSVSLADAVLRARGLGSAAGSVAGVEEESVFLRGMMVLNRGRARPSQARAHEAGRAEFARREMKTSQLRRRGRRRSSEAATLPMMFR